MNRRDYLNRLFSLKDDYDFESLALKTFRFQSIHNKVYRKFIEGLGIDSSKIDSIAGIPFLPVELFKTNEVVTGDNTYQRIFTSSGTTAEVVSRHFIKSEDFYEDVCLKIFSQFYGDPSQYTILALLPSYLEREGSSLIFMMEKLIEKTGKQDSGFYLHDHQKLFGVLERLQKQNQKTILFGVTYALLDFVARYKLNFPGLIVMDTGGMKGKRREMIREEVHEELCSGFGVAAIHSEYGMTELLSQAYSNGNGKFKSPWWMKILIRDPYDPLKLAAEGTSGGINIIDLANIDSCCFLSTQDLGKITGEFFEVLGRFDFSDIRGCNLMID